MNALLHPQPPPCRLRITSNADDALHDIAELIQHNDESYGPNIHLETGQLCIIFAKPPDPVIRNLIEIEVHNICDNAVIYWEVTENEDTT